VKKVVKKIVEASLNNRYGVARVRTLYRDCSLYADAVERRNNLFSKIQGYVAGDAEFTIIAQNLHQAKYNAEEIKKKLRDDIEVSTIIEEQSRYTSDQPENTTWQTSFMKRVSDEADRLSKDTREPSQSSQPTN